MENHNLSMEKIIPAIRSPLYGESVKNFLLLLEETKSTIGWELLKILSVPYLYQAFEKLIDSSVEPMHQYKGLLNNLKDQMSSINQSEFNSLFSSIPYVEENEKTQSLLEVTGSHYGHLFSGFSDLNFFKEAKRLLEVRLMRNEIYINSLNELSILDAGSGGGRYAVAWKLAGAKKVVGLDISENGIADAKSRIIKAGIEDIEFTFGNVLDIPFEDNSFDIVFSNGVLHHTVDWKKGIAELLRVLKKGGFGWLYLIESPGGIFWDNIELMRYMLKDVSKEKARLTLASLGIPGNKIFYMLDHVMVPINIRLTEEEIETELTKNGAKQIRRLKRGADFDRIEYIFRKRSFARELYGVGENRYIFYK